jgi:hypothetical protein|tara:strand:+ start:44163 stop:45023 length:861 start_codon:yes stop_codon:yes gene_type:complete
MKSTITFFLLLSSSVLFAQLPGNSPSFTVTQQVGSAEISFTYKASIIEDLIENLADDRGIFYPGGKTNFIVRTNKDLLFNEEKTLVKGNYVGGIKVGEDGTYSLTLQTEYYSLKADSEKDSKIPINIFQLEKLPSFECSIQGQDFAIMPYQGGINFSSVIIVIGNQAFQLSFSVDDSELINKIRVDIEKADKNETEKFKFAAQYCFDSNQNLKEAVEWAIVAYEGDINHVNAILLAKIMQKIGDLPGALNIAKESLSLLQNDESLSKVESDKIENEIDDLMNLWAN